MQEPAEQARHQSVGCDFGPDIWPTPCKDGLSGGGGWIPFGPHPALPHEGGGLAFGGQNGRVIRALVFDFDGLIVDSERPVYRAWAELYSHYGEELSVDLWKTVIGHAPGFFDPVAELEQRLGVGLDGQALRARYRARQLELMHVEPILPGVPEWGEEARAMGVRLGVASNSSRAMQRRYSGGDLA